MSKRIVIALSGVLVVILLLGGTVLVADAAGTKKIPKGVTIGGVAVGGLTAEQARERVNRELLGQMSRPIRVVHGDRTWTLTPAAAKIRVHFDDSIDEALRTMMREVVTKGTATALARVPGGAVHGKTGTAEYDDNPAHTHAWFVGWQGDVAFAVFVERGGDSGDTAVPIAERFLRGLHR